MVDDSSFVVRGFRAVTSCNTRAISIPSIGGPDHRLLPFSRGQSLYIIDKIPHTRHQNFRSKSREWPKLPSLYWWPILHPLLLSAGGEMTGRNMARHILHPATKLHNSKTTNPASQVQPPSTKLYRSYKLQPRHPDPIVRKHACLTICN